MSVISNAIRGVIGLAASLLIAQGLNPSGYGDLMFLLGSFVATRSLLDMGTSSAFYTFLSRHAQERQFYLSYFAWLALQFTITLLVVALIMPSSLVDRVWLGHNREIVVVAFLATFMQQQVWQTAGQIGESLRKTVKLQLLNLGVAITYLAMLSLLLLIGELSIENILFLMIAQYAVATLLAYQFLKEDKAGSVGENTSLRQMVLEYWTYCKPLIILSLFSFLYDFADKWMLQKFGGATQQGYFQISNQISAISLLATASILSIFWKEVSNALARHDHIRVEMLTRKISRGLVMLSAIFSGLLLPWSEQIVNIFLGPAYAQAWPVLAIMLLYPIFQSMGQISGTMFLAGGHTKKYMLVNMGNMLASFALSYLLLAPPTGVLVPGLGMGAMGIATKMVLLAMIFANIQVWVVARFSGWKFDWVYQIVGIPLMLGLGYLIKMLTGLLWNLEGIGKMQLIVPVIFSGCTYAVLVVLSIWLFPWLLGIKKEEIKNLFKGRAG